jgi:hypothetical protein
MVFAVLRAKKNLWADVNEKLMLVHFLAFLRDPHVVCDLYVNYDCDVRFHEDVVGQIIELFSKFGYKRIMLGGIGRCGADREAEQRKDQR